MDKEVVVDTISKVVVTTITVVVVVAAVVVTKITTNAIITIKVVINKTTITEEEAVANFNGTLSVEHGGMGILALAVSKLFLIPLKGFLHIINKGIPAL